MLTLSSGRTPGQPNNRGFSVPVPVTRETPSCRCNSKIQNLQFVEIRLENNRAKEWLPSMVKSDLEQPDYNLVRADYDLAQT